MSNKLYLDAKLIKPHSAPEIIAMENRMFLRLMPWIGLAYMGVAWGLGFSIAKIATANGFTPIGLAFWSSLLSGVMLLGYVVVRGRSFIWTKASLKLYLIVALLGAAIPSTCFYFSATILPAGVLSITVTLVPILTYALALLLKTELFSAVRLSGVILGVIAIFLLVGPKNSLPGEGALPWVLLACLSSLCYAIENIFIAQRGISDVGAIRLACGMHIFSSIIILPFGLVLGDITMPDITDWQVTSALVILAIINATAYAAFVACIASSGPLFASQVGYVVTLAGVFWGIAIFGETHSIWVWVSFVTMLVGLAFVSPRKQHA